MEDVHDVIGHVKRTLKEYGATAQLDKKTMDAVVARPPYLQVTGEMTMDGEKMKYGVQFERSEFSGRNYHLSPPGPLEWLMELI